jgi:CspA family cold shock protein
MPEGTIKWFDSGKGYGFILQGDGENDLFVHHSETEGYALNEGDKVEFEIGEGRKGPCATKVKKLQGAASTGRPPRPAFRDYEQGRMDDLPQAG